MSAEAEACLRLAWDAERDGRPGRRDVLLTLALASAGPEDAWWAARCRDRLVASHPDHIIAPYATLAEALEDPRVASAIRGLRQAFPPCRIESLILRSDARRGPYLGPTSSVRLIIGDLFGPVLPAGSRRDSAAEPPAPVILARAMHLARAHVTADPRAGLSRTFPAWCPPEASSHEVPAAESPAPATSDASLEDIRATYLAFLVGIALLLSTTLRESEARATS